MFISNYHIILYIHTNIQILLTHLGKDIYLKFSQSPHCFCSPLSEVGRRNDDLLPPPWGLTVDGPKKSNWFDDGRSGGLPDQWIILVLVIGGMDYITPQTQARTIPGIEAVFLLPIGWLYTTYRYHPLRSNLNNPLTRVVVVFFGSGWMFLELLLWATFCMLGPGWFLAIWNWGMKVGWKGFQLLSLLEELNGNQIFGMISCQL